MKRALLLALIPLAAWAGPIDAARRAREAEKRHQEELQEAVDGTDPEATEARDAPLQAVDLAISVPKAVYKMGEVVTLSHRLKNKGESPVLLLKCLDGSAEGRRYPHVFLEVKDAGGTSIPQSPGGGRCRNLNQLREADFLELKPGESGDPCVLEGGFPYWPLKVDRPGAYRVTLVYVLKEPFVSDAKLNGPASEEARGMLGRVPRGELRSNAIELEFRE